MYEANWDGIDDHERIIRLRDGLKQLQRIVDNISNGVNSALVERDEKLAALESRIAALEAKGIG